jgi:hypothetical protein
MNIFLHFFFFFCYRPLVSIESMKFRRERCTESNVSLLNVLTAWYLIKYRDILPYYLSPGRGWEFFFSPTASRWALGPTQLPTQWVTGALSPVV